MCQVKIFVNNIDYAQFNYLRLLKHAEHVYEFISSFYVTLWDEETLQFLNGSSCWCNLVQTGASVLTTTNWSFANDRWYSYTWHDTNSNSYCFWDSSDQTDWNIINIRQHTNSKLELKVNTRLQEVE